MVLEVGYVGQILAMVIAGTAVEQALDAAEEVVVKYQELKPVVDVEKAASRRARC